MQAELKDEKQHLEREQVTTKAYQSRLLETEVELKKVKDIIVGFSKILF